MPSLATLDRSPPSQTLPPAPAWRPPSPAPARPANDGSAGLSAEQQTLDASVAAEAGMGSSEVATLSAYGIRPSELDPEATRRMAVGLARLAALRACEGGNATACDLVGPGLVGHRSTETAAGEPSDEWVVEDADFTLRLTTRTGADGQTERVLYYQDVDGTFLSGVSSEPVEQHPGTPVTEPTPVPEEGLRSLLEGAVLGDLADNTTWSAMAGQALVGLIPVLGQVADVRDTAAAVADVVQGKEGAWGRLAGAAVGWVPGVGDALKGGLRAGMKLGTEVVQEGAERLVKAGAAEAGVRAAREGAEEGTEAALRTVPQGIDPQAFQQAGALVRERAGHFGGEILVQGSRAAGTARPDSDLDIAILVDSEAFDAILHDKFKRPNPGSAAERTMQWAAATGKIQAGELKLSRLRKELSAQLGVEVDLSVIRRGGPFDQPPYVPM